MSHSERRHLREFYEEEASRINHQKLMYVTGSRHDVWWHRKRLKHIVSLLVQILKEGHVDVFVDVGCAEGYYVDLISSLNSELVCIGVDISRKYIEKAKKNVKGPNIDFVVCDVENLPFQQRCLDVVLCSEVLEHVTNYRKAFDELYRVTEKYLVLSFPGHSYIYHIAVRFRFFRGFVNDIMADVGHISEISIDKIRHLMKAYRNNVSIETRVGGALPLQLYETIPSIRLVNTIDHAICKMLRRLNIVGYTTIHVMKIRIQRKP